LGTAEKAIYHLQNAYFTGFTLDDPLPNRYNKCVNKEAILRGFVRGIKRVWCILLITEYFVCEFLRNIAPSSLLKAIIFRRECRLGMAAMNVWESID
jgi:hypothetical protein